MLSRRSLLAQFAAALGVLALPIRRRRAAAIAGTPAADLIAPLHIGDALPLGWSVASISPIGGGAATLTLHHARGNANVRVCHRDPRSSAIAHSDSLDFFLLNRGLGMRH